MPVDRARSATRSIGGAVARPAGSPITTISPVRSKNTTRAAAAPYVITDTGQTVSSGSGISPIPQDMEIVPRNLAQGAMMRSGSAPAGGTHMIVDEGGPGPSGASHSWTVLNQQNNTYDERQEHFHEHHQHEHMHDNRFVNVDTHEHLHDNRSVGVTVQQISMDPVIIAEATEAVAQARAHEQHVTASAEAAVAQARSNEHSSQVNMDNQTWTDNWCHLWCHTWEFIITTNIQYPIPNIQYPISNIQYPISNIQYPIPIP